MDISRSSRPQLFCKKGVLQNFANFHLCRSLFFNKIVGLRPPSYNFIKKALALIFSSEFCKVFKSTHFAEHLQKTAPTY